MAPVTRTRSKALDKASNEGDGRAASTIEPSSSSSTTTPTTRKRRAIPIHTRDEENATELRMVRTETQLLSGKSKRPRSSSVADSQDGDGYGHATLEPQSASKQLEEEASQRLASQSVEPDLELSPQGNKKGTKSNHVVFGDDDDIDKYVAAAAAKTSKQAPEPAAQEDAEDSDEAPEAISTKAAAKETLESAKALADATEKYAESLPFPFHLNQKRTKTV